MTKHISRVQPGDLVRRKSDQTIHTVETTDAGACQLRVSGALPTSMESWSAFNHYAPDPEATLDAPVVEADPFPKGAA